jgi:hypothetical protein
MNSLEGLNVVNLLKPRVEKIEKDWIPAGVYPERSRRAGMTKMSLSNKRCLLRPRKGRGFVGLFVNGSNKKAPRALEIKREGLKSVKGFVIFSSSSGCRSRRCRMSPHNHRSRHQRLRPAVVVCPSSFAGDSTILIPLFGLFVLVSQTNGCTQEEQGCIFTLWHG